MKAETKGRIVSAVVPKFFLLGGRLGRWYERNPYHRFQAGDILILRNRGTVGYGIRPVAVVNGYEVKDSEHGIIGKYDVTMHRDEGGNSLQWARRNEVPPGVKRASREHEHHYKWNVEDQFKRVRVKSVDEALALYASREAEEQKRTGFPSLGF